MSRIEWDQPGSRLYEVGVDRGVLYRLSDDDEYTNGVPWNGLTKVEGKDSGSSVTPLYSGDVKVTILTTYEEYGGTISAYTYPDSFEECIGSMEAVPGIYMQQQNRNRFGVCYRTMIGNDLSGTDYGYKLHLIYNAEITSKSATRETINEKIDAADMTWDFVCIPMPSEEYLPYSEIIIDSTKFSKLFMQSLESILYGTENDVPRMPDLDELTTLYYQDEPVPDDWVGYPYETLYPSTSIFPWPIFNAYPAERDYAEGETIELNGQFYRATRNISAGSVIRPIPPDVSDAQANEYVLYLQSLGITDLPNAALSIVEDSPEQPGQGTEEPTNNQEPEDTTLSAAIEYQVSAGTISAGSISSYPESLVREVWTQDAGSHLEYKVPVGSDILSVENSGIPNYLSDLTISASVSDDYKTCYYSISNLTDHDITVTEAFTITTTIYYVESEE